MGGRGRALRLQLCVDSSVLVSRGGVLCGDEVHPVRVALWAWLGSWLASTWAGVALAGECCVCAAPSVACVVVGRCGGVGARRAP
eukprot:scaffold74050_cov37-Tisochrysis_lutea.AAC.2